MMPSKYLLSSILCLVLGLVGQMAQANMECSLALTKTDTARLKSEIAGLISELQDLNSPDSTSLRNVLSQEIDKKIHEFQSLTGQELDPIELRNLISKLVKKSQAAKKKNQAERNKIEIVNVEIDQELPQTTNLPKPGISQSGGTIRWEGRLYDQDFAPLTQAKELYQIMASVVPTLASDVRLGNGFDKDLLSIDTQHQGTVFLDLKNNTTSRLGQDVLFKKAPPANSNIPTRTEDGIFHSGIDPTGNYLAVYHNHQDRVAIWNPQTHQVIATSSKIGDGIIQANAINALSNEVLIHYFEKSYLMNLKTKKVRDLRTSINQVIIPIPNSQNILTVEESSTELKFQIRSENSFNTVHGEITVPRPLGWWDIVGYQFYESSSENRVFVQSKRANGKFVTIELDLKAMNVRNVHDALLYYLGEGIWLKNHPTIDGTYIMFGNNSTMTTLEAREIFINQTTGKIYLHEHGTALKALSVHSDYK